MAMGLAHGPAGAAPTPAPSPSSTRARSKPPTAAPAAARAPAPAPGKPAPATKAPAAGTPRPATVKGAPPSKTDDKTPPAQVKRARDLWYRGVDAFRAGNYEEARRAFAECYQLMPKSDVLRNLSISEIQSGHYVSAARHLTQLLASPPGELPNTVREEATSRLAQAEAQVGQLKIGVDVAGAEISIDGSVIGRSPLEGTWYLEPGQHEVLVSKAGYPAESRQVFALAGVAIPIDVSLETLRREQAADAKAAELMGTREGQAPIAMDDSGISAASTAVLITTGTIAAASLAAGIIFTVAANGHDADADQLAERLPGSGACSDPTFLREDCSSMIQAREDAQTDRERAMIGFIGFGVASAATLGYAVWLSIDDDEPVSQTTTRVEPSFSLGRGSASINLHGRF